MQAKKARQADIDRKRAEVRKRLEETAKAKKAKKGFMTPERKKKLRVSDSHVTVIAFATSSLSFRHVCLTAQCVYCANSADILEIICNGDGRCFLYFSRFFQFFYIGKS